MCNIQPLRARPGDVVFSKISRERSESQKGEFGVQRKWKTGDRQSRRGGVLRKRPSQEG
jgi:hypothetical protein